MFDIYKQNHTYKKKIKKRSLSVSQQYLKDKQIEYKTKITELLKEKIIANQRFQGTKTYYRWMKEDQ